MLIIENDYLDIAEQAKELPLEAIEQQIKETFQTWQTGEPPEEWTGKVIIE